MAIRWVYDNIQFFNGDRNSITLFGPNAGAASAGLLMVNPRTRNMITRVIAQVMKLCALISSCKHNSLHTGQ